MIKIILIFIIIFIKYIKGIETNIYDYYDDNDDNDDNDNDSFCKYLIKNRDLIDKELYYYNNEKIRNELYNDRKKIDQMIYQLCTTTEKF